MGSWGTGIFQDDFASDLRDLYSELVSLDFSDNDIIVELSSTFRGVEGIDASTYAIALALLQHKAGRLTDDVKQRAVSLIDSGRALADWTELAGEGDRTIKQRKKALEKAKQTIESPQPPRKSPRPSKELRQRIDRSYSQYPWHVDHCYAFLLSNGNWTVFSVTDVHQAKLQRHYQTSGNRYVMAGTPELLQPCLLLLNYCDATPPQPNVARELKPLLRTMTEEDRNGQHEAIEAIRKVFAEGANETFEQFYERCRQNFASMTDQQFQNRHQEYTTYCRTQLSRYVDTDVAINRFCQQRFLLDPRATVPEDRLVDLGAAEHFDCENVCVIVTWDALDQRLSAGWPSA